METVSGLTQDFPYHCVNPEIREVEHCVWLDNDHRPHFKGHDIQDWAKGHDTELRFHLPSSTEETVGKKKINIKQHIKLLTNKTTLAK